jgi:hypothetical protein
MEDQPRRSARNETKENAMTGSFAEKARTRRIVALQALQALRAGVAPKTVNLCTNKTSRFPPVDRVLASLTTQDPLRLMAA